MKTWTEKSKASFWEKVDQSGGPAACWPWTLSRSGNGYGQVNMGKSHGPCLRAHRVAYALAHGEIVGNGSDTRGVCVLHSCDNPACCNPAHLRLGTHAENLAEMRAKGRLVTPQKASAEIQRRSAAYPELVAHIKALEAHLTRGAPAIEGRALREQQRTLLRKLGEST